MNKEKFMAIRHAMSFSKSRSQPVVINKTYVINQQPAVKKNNGVFWGSFAGGFLTSIFNSISNNYNSTPSINMGDQNVYEYLNKVLKTKTEKTDSTDNDDNTSTPTNNTEEIPTNNTEEIPTDNTEKTQTANTNKPEYFIKEKQSTLETVNTIPFGGPWHYAQYYTDENGQQLKIGSSEFTAIMNALKTQMGEVEGDRSKRVLPKEITVNGKTYTLMGAEEREKLGLKGQDGGVDTRYTVKLTGSTYSVWEKIDDKTDPECVGSGLTKEAAEALKLQKENEAEAAANA